MTTDELQALQLLDTAFDESEGFVQLLGELIEGEVDTEPIADADMAQDVIVEQSPSPPDVVGL